MGKNARSFIAFHTTYVPKVKHLISINFLFQMTNIKHYIKMLMKVITPKNIKTLILKDKQDVH